MTGHPPSWIGVDVGGTTIKAVRRTSDGTLTNEHRSTTPRPDPSGRRTVHAVSEIVGRLGGPEAERAVGVVVPGIVDDQMGIAISSINVGWRNVALKAMLESALGSPVAFGQDVRAGALAESRTGAAAGATSVTAYLAVGTGVAAAVLIDGRPLVAGGWAGEVGQLLLTEGPHRGHRVEEVCSAAATARRSGAPDGRTVTARVAAGEPQARHVWQETVDVLAGVIANIVGLVAPSIVVVGGGLAGAGPLLLDPLRTEVARRIPGLRPPTLAAAFHGDRAAAVGAALMATEQDVRGQEQPILAPPARTVTLG